MSSRLTEIYPKTIIEKFCSESHSIAQFLRKLQLKENGANYKLFKKLKELYNLSDSHFTGRGWSKGKQLKNFREIKIEDVLVENSSYSCTSSLKKKLLKNNLIEKKCNICSISNWNGKDLSLQLDHINGINNDNRIENLRFLCPNCHSQTNTFAGRNIKSGKRQTYLQENGERILNNKKCLRCANLFVSKKNRKFCSSNCSNKYNKGGLRCSKSPSKKELEKLVWLKPTSQIAKDFQVSDNAVAKWCKNYNISKPPRGYWAKKSGLSTMPNPV